MATTPSITVPVGVEFDAPSVAFLRRDRETAGLVRRILNLPDGNWSDIKIAVNLGEVATAEVTFLLRTDQITALAALATLATHPQVDRRPHSRACGVEPHQHGKRCSFDCPTCGGKG